jgi:DNA-binding transcriptional MerR regulator
MIAIKTVTELTVPAMFACIGTGRVPELPGDRAIGQPVIATQMPNTMEPEESLIADVRGNWAPREMVERKLMALSYTCRPGYFSRTHDGGEARPRPPVSEQQSSEPASSSSSSGSWPSNGPDSDPRRLAELEKKHDRLEKQIKKLEEAGEDKFEGIKQDLSKALEEVDQNIEELTKKLEKDKDK